MQAAVKTASLQVDELQACQQTLASLPAKEMSFKRLFDEFSEGVSYKQQYQDKNAFLVYYTQGFDGIGRPSIEAQDGAREEKMRNQFGARNEAWIAVEDARTELAFLQKSGVVTDADGEVSKALARAAKAIDEYVALAPAEVVQQARQQLLSASSSAGGALGALS